MRTLLLALTLFGVVGSCHASGPFRERLGPELALLDSLQAAGWAVDTSAHGEDQRLISSGLAILLGPFGAHRLYLGTTTKVAIIYGVTFGGFGVLALIDLGHLLFTKDLEAYRNNDRVFMWTHRKEPTPP